MKVDMHGPIEMHPDLDPTKPLPHERAPQPESVVACARGDLHRVDCSGVRRIYMHPDDVDELTRSLKPLLLVSTTAPRDRLFWAGGIDIMKSAFVPLGTVAFEPPARRLEGK